MPSLDEIQATLVRARRRRPVIDVTLAAAERDVSVGGGIIAGAVAFRVFLFMVPFVFLLVAGFGLAADAADRPARELAEDAGAAGLIASSIDAVAQESLGTKLTVFLAGGFASVLAARTFLKVLVAAHVIVWGLPPARIRRPVRATVGLVLTVTIGLAMVQALSYLRDRSLPAGLVGTALFIALPAGVWLMASLTIFPHDEGAGWRDLVAGALLVGVGIQALHLFTIVWIVRSLEHKTEAYGAVGTSLAVLLWAYVLGRILTGAAVLNATLWFRRHPNEA